MRKETVLVHTYRTKCFACNKEIPVYYTVGDFYEGKVICRYNVCGELYCYAPEEDYYQRPLIEQIEQLKCAKCGIGLKNNLVQSHKNINCCGYEFSLDDDFADHLNQPENMMIPIEVYMLYAN